MKRRACSACDRALRRGSARRAYVLTNDGIASGLVCSPVRAPLDRGRGAAPDDGRAAVLGLQAGTGVGLRNLRWPARRARAGANVALRAV